MDEVFRYCMSYPHGTHYRNPACEGDDGHTALVLASDFTALRDAAEAVLKSVGGEPAGIPSMSSLTNLKAVLAALPKET